jgi:hypothetical protein
MYTLSFIFNQLRYALCSTLCASSVAQKMLIIVTGVGFWYSETNNSTGVVVVLEHIRPDQSLFSKERGFLFPGKERSQSTIHNFALDFMH